MSTTLKEQARIMIAEQKERDAKEAFEACKDILSNIVYPEIQQDVFENIFMNQFRTLINEGKDPYLDEKEERSISNMWVLVAGSLNTPVRVVNGEGPNQKHLGTLPSFIAPMNIKTDTKSTNMENRFASALADANADDTVGYMSKLNTEMKGVATDIKERANMEEHKKNWLEAIDHIENEIKKSKSSSETIKKEENKKEEKKESGIEFQW